MRWRRTDLVLGLGLLCLIGASFFLGRTLGRKPNFRPAAEPVDGTQSTQPVTVRHRTLIDPERQMLVDFDASPDQFFSDLKNISDPEIAVENFELAISSSNDDEFQSLKRWVENLPEGKLKTECFSKLLEVWVRRDRRQASETILSLEGEASDPLKKRLYDLVPISEKEEIFKRMPNSLQFDLIAGNTVEISRYFPESAVSGLEKLPDSEERDLLVEKFFKTMVYGNELGAPSYLNPTKTHEFGDPLRAAELTEGLEDPRIRDVAAYAISFAWSGLDSESASSWVDSLPAGRFYDIAALGLVKEVSKFNPQLVLPWAESIQDSEIRSAALEAIKVAESRKNER